MPTISNTFMKLIARAACLAVFAFAFAAVSFAATKVTAVKGEVSVRHGVSEEWTVLAAGDVLKPDDTIRLGKHATATVVTDANNKLVIPELVMLDIADIRMLTQEELLLQLAMERVRSVPARNGGNDLSIPRTTTVHGDNKGVATHAVATAGDGSLQLNGVRVLYQNGYYGTSVLRAKEIYRLIPSLAANIDSRMMVASALEKMNLNSEALNEYNDIAKSGPTKEQSALIQQRVTALQGRAR